MKTFAWAGVLLIATTAPCTLGQDVRTISPQQVEMGGWLYIPTLKNGSVESILTLRLADPTGDNLTAVWYRQQSDGSWEKLGWDSQSNPQIIASVKALLNLPDATDAFWPEPLDSETAGLPQLMRSDVLIDDPLEPILSGIDPDASAELLMSLDHLGWQSAYHGPDIETCGGKTIDLPLLVASFESATDDDDMAAGIIYAEAVAAACVPQGPSCIRTATFGSSQTTYSQIVWTPGTPTTIPMTGGECQIQNHWTATAMETQCRKLSVKCANCSVIKRTQCRYMNVTFGSSQNDLNTALPTCLIPPGYSVPPTPYQPHFPPPLETPMNDWSVWAPSEESICP